MRSPHHLLVKTALHLRQWRVFGMSARGWSIAITDRAALESFMVVSLFGIGNWTDGRDFMVADR
jgi:hypothetical protein